MKTVWKLMIVVSCLVLFSTANALASEPWCRGAPGTCVTNVTSVALTISWTTLGHSEVGTVQWGTSPDSLTNTANDKRGAAAANESHYVVLGGLAPEIPSYYTVTSGGVTYSNGGEPWVAQTGLTLPPDMPEFMAVHVFQNEGISTPAVGSIIYLQSFSGASESAFISKVVSDPAGLVLLDLNALRTTSNQEYFDWKNNDLFVYADGNSMGNKVFEGSVPDGRSLDLALSPCNGCFIEGSCYANEAPHPSGACATCDGAKSRTRWASSPSTTVCRAAVHDCDRGGPGEIAMRVFSEDEILAER